MSCGYETEDFDFDEYNDFSEQRQVRGRKPHRCEECGGSIEAGERHEVYKGKTRMGFFDLRRCFACLTLIELAAPIIETCPVWGNLDTWLEDVEWALREKGETLESRGLCLSTEWRERHPELIAIARRRAA